MDDGRLLLAFFLCAFAAAQGQTPSPETDRADLIRQRAEWFYEQRAYPLGYIPAGIRLEALRQMDRMVALQPATSRLAPIPGAGPGGPGSGLALPLSGTATAPALAGRQPGATDAASSTQWTNIGPQPTSTSFRFSRTSGRVSALAVDPRNGNVVYLGGAQGGVWKTTDGGVSWTVLTDAQPSLAVGAIALDPSNPDIVYVGTGEQNFGADNYYGVGILKSTDGGATWANLASRTFAGPFSSATGGARIGALAVHPTNGQIVLAGAQIFSSGSTPGIYRSTDGGASWTNVLPGAPGTDVLFDPSNPRNAYAALGSIFSASANGVFKSTDSGQTWTRISGTGTNVLPSTNAGRIALGLAPSSPQTLYAGIHNIPDGTLLGFFKTTDGGQNWTALSNTPDYCRPQCWYDHVVLVHPTNADVVFVGGSDRSGGNSIKLFRSTNGGTGWTEISVGPSGEQLHPDLHALALTPGAGKLYAGNDGGVWSTTDVTNATVNWTNLNGSLSITQFYPGHSIHPANVNFGFGGTQDNGTERYTGQPTWEWVTCGDGGWTAIDFSNPSTVYAACQRIQVLKSTANGDFPSWSSAQGGIATTDRVQFIPPLVIDPSNTRTLYFGTFRVYQTTDGAGTWAAISPDLTGGGTIKTIAVAPSSSNTVYAGTNDSKVQVTTNAGAGAAATWTDRSAGLPLRTIIQIAVDPTSPQIAYVTFSGFSGFADNLGHVFKTVNGGGAWVDITGNLPNTPVNDLVVDPDVPTILYAATDIGVFSSATGGGTWSVLGSGLPRVAVLGLKLHRASRTLRAATHGRGMWDLGVPLPNPNPTPALSALSPSSATAGGAPFTLTVNGSNFVSGAVVRWNGSDRTTTFVSATQLTAAILAGDIATAGTAQVTVFNPAPGGGLSGTLAFTISGGSGNPVPSINQLSPSSAAAGGAAFTLTVSGSNFVSGSVLRWNGSNRTTTVASSTQLTAAIPASDIATAGTAQVTVFNPAPGGGLSGALTFTISGGSNPVPAMTLLAPSGARAGGAAFTLTIFGNNFVQTSVVRWNGFSRTTTFVSSTQLTAAILVSDIAAAGTAQVTVFNPAPGGGTSGAANFTISVSGSIPVIPAGSAVNAAGFQTGLAVAAGGIAAVFGSNLATQLLSAPGLPLPRSLGGTTLLFNGNIGVPLFFVFSGQVNIQVPWELLGQTRASLTATAGGFTGSPTSINLAPSSPGIFTTNSQGTGQGAILIAGEATVAAPTGSLGGRDARPVQRGQEFIAIFCTGLGDVTNRPASGAVSPFQPPLAETLTKPTVTIGGVQVAASDIPFSGLAPFFVGLYQVNAKVPANAPTGDAVPVVVSIGGVSSNAVNIAVQ